MSIFKKIRAWWENLTTYPEVDQVESEEQSEEIHIPVRDANDALYVCNGCKGHCVAPENEAKQCPHCGSSSLTFLNRV